MRADRAGVATVAVPGIHPGDVSNDGGGHIVESDPHPADKRTVHGTSTQSLPEFTTRRITVANIDVPDAFG
jgi:hypothetical protein